MEIFLQADQKAFLWLNGWVGQFPWLDGVMRLLVSDYLIPVVLALILLGLWFGFPATVERWRAHYGVMSGLMGIGLSNQVVELFNQFIFRPRPFVDLEVALLFYKPTDSSFPANPAALAFAIAVSVWLWSRYLGAVCLSIAVLYSVSRVYAGVSYPLDILGGAAIGTVTALLASLILRKWDALPTFVLRIAKTFYLA